MHRIKTFLIIFTAILFSSCFSTKRITYFQKPVGGKDTIDIAREYVPKIQKGDILSIYVNSISVDASSIFNPYTANTVVPSTPVDLASGLSQAASPGYLVDQSGNITMPLIGNVAVNGLSLIEATQIIRIAITKYLKEPSVNVRFQNFKISILGEVNKPGVYVVPNAQITLPEAITLAGDATAFSKVDEVEVIREIDGKKQFATINLTGRDVFSSPYYYLHENDIIYVKPGTAKALQSETFVRVLPLVVSAVTLILLIVSKI